MGLLEGKTALITGGSSGIGHAVVRRYKEEGANVGVLDKSAEGLRGLHEEFHEVLTITGDVTSIRDNEQAVLRTVDEFGSLDILVGNAGVADNFATLEQLPSEKLGLAFDELFGVNVKGYFFSAKAAIPELLMSNGCMIFTASSSSYYAGFGGALYVASKHAVAGLIRQLAHELAPKIRVNGVAPGYVHTNITGLHTLNQGPTVPPPELVVKKIPLGFAAEPEDVAGVYVFLASDKNSRVLTGEIILADSGVAQRGRKW